MDKPVIEPALCSLALSEPKKKLEVYLLVDEKVRSEIASVIAGVAEKKNIFSRKIEIIEDALDNLGKIAFTFTMRPGMIDKFKDLPGVEALEVVKEYEAMSATILPLLDVTVTLHQIDKIWALGERGKNAVLGIIDTGWDGVHPDLVDAVIEARGFVSGNPTWKDGHGHGSFCLSIDVGRGVASNGKYTGIAPESKAYVAKVLSDSGTGQTGDIVKGIDWVAGKPIDVLSMSLGRYVTPVECKYRTSLSIALDNLCDKKMIIPCCASGNASEDYICDPAQSTKAITVGACTKRDTIAGFTSRRDANPKCWYPTLPVPQIYAVGEGMIAARAKGTKMGSPLDDYYTIASGTSAATPVIAGFNLLLTSAFGRQDIESRRLRLTRYAKEIELG